MAVADFDIGVGPTLAARAQERIGTVGLFVLLSLFTLTTMDGNDSAPRIISAVLLLFTAAYFVMPPGASKFRVGLPAICLLAMTIWGVLQTLLPPQKIWVAGWDGVLFWFTAAVISLLGASTFHRNDLAMQFRVSFVYVASGIALLDLLQQATRTGSFYWFIPSRYNLVFGPFAYWNNLAQLEELAFPITLWTGLAGGRPNILLLLLSALQICAVIASGSRAGTVLVLSELIGVIVLAYLRQRNRRFLTGAAVAVVLSGIFIYSAGFTQVAEKLQRSDQLSVRREINLSSLSMIAERPLTGWGLNSYVPVYRMFARYDDGTYVNRAHNDWLQFAAEGGVPFAACILALFVWSIKPALRSGWGIGVIALGIHALVDYPFARLGVCGWYFALIAMLAYSQSLVLFERNKPVRE